MRDGIRGGTAVPPEDDGTIEHGHERTYDHFSCRCRQCRKAHAEFSLEARRARAARLEADPTLVPHGRPSTFTNWDCRCGPCSDAHAGYLRDRRRESTVTSVR